MRKLAFAILALLTAAIAPFPGASAQDYNAILAAPDRSEADRKTDQARHPDKFLAFTGVKPGMKVLDVASGGGYTTELMARVVGPSGKVYAQDAPTASERARTAFEARIKKPELANVVRLVTPYDAPLTSEVRDLDIVTLFYSYHDIAFMPVDRAKMNKAVFDALKPGGVYIVADHSAALGAGTSVAQTLHRIEEATLRKEVEAAGFKFVAEADFLRSPEDKRDGLIFRSPVPVDAFVHKYEKPR
jgi:predicted methyltransferase